MSLQDWLNNGWLRTHKTDRQEMVNLLAIADRDIADASANAFLMTGSLELHIMLH